MGLDLVWSGLVWSSLVWSGRVSSDLVWSDLVWSGLVWPEYYSISAADMFVLVHSNCDHHIQTYRQSFFLQTCCRELPLG